MCVRACAGWIYEESHCFCCPLLTPDITHNLTRWSVPVRGAIAYFLTPPERGAANHFPASRCRPALHSTQGGYPTPFSASLSFSLALKNCRKELSEPSQGTILTVLIVNSRSARLPARLAKDSLRRYVSPWISAKKANFNSSFYRSVPLRLQHLPGHNKKSKKFASSCPDESYLGSSCKLFCSKFHEDTHKRKNSLRDIQPAFNLTLRVITFNNISTYLSFLLAHKSKYSCYSL